MTDEGKTPEKPQKSSSPATRDSPAAYASRVSAGARWAVGALAAVGAAAVTKLSLDRLGKGDLDGPLIFWAYAGLTLFALGVIALVGAVVWLTWDARVTLGYLLSDDRNARKIASFLDENAYLLGGPLNLKAFRSRLTKLVQAPRPLSDKDMREFRRLLSARDTILTTGRSERIRTIAPKAMAWIVAGALAVTLGAATFALATNRDVVLRTDRLAQEQRDREEVITGELLPKTPSSVLLRVPDRDKVEVGKLVGEECETSGIRAILLEVDSPPVDAQPSGDSTHTFHVITERTDTCAVTDMWVPADWVAARPAETMVPPTAPPAPSEGGAGAADEPTVGPE